MRTNNKKKGKKKVNKDMFDWNEDFPNTAVGKECVRRKKNGSNKKTSFSLIEDKFTSL